MSVAVGARVGPYHVVEKLGEGGMGDVYRARDTRLHRDVALKVLPDAFTGDPDRLARFQREAEILATLNHVNIGHIYGLEEAESLRALVLELVEGPTLADRLTRGPIALDEALPIASQIADAVEAAHARDIIHRDLEPANIKLRPDGTVKVLDFGLAKALAQEWPGDGDVSAPTMTGGMTWAGVVLGTPAYMSPEQAKGRATDRRADVWAFGCVLFELLAGRRAFDGETASETIAKVLERDAEWSALPGGLPPALLRLLRRCLQKDPRRRLHDMADVRLELEEAASPGLAASAESAVSIAAATSAPRPVWRRLAGWAAPVVLGGGAWVAMDLVGPRSQPPAQDRGQPVRLDVVLPPGVRLAVDSDHPALALSPDGSTLVFVGERDGVRQLFVRRLREPDARPLAGTEGAVSPFFSPDGRWLAYHSGNTLARIAVAGGVPVKVVATSPAAVAHGATWSLNDTVLLAQSANSGLSAASMAGDELRGDAPTLLTPRERPYAWPSALPDGRHVLFVDRSSEYSRVAVLALADRNIRTLVNGGTSPRFSPTGHLLFTRDAALYAMPFDLARVAPTGDAYKLLDGVLTHGRGVSQFAVAGHETLAYVAGGETFTTHELVWVDRAGRAERLSDARETFMTPRLSPDGRHLAVASFEGANLDLWRLDLVRGALTRVTVHPGEDFGPVWSPDGRTLALSSEIGEDPNPDEMGPGLAWIVENGPPESLMPSPGWGNWDFPSSWSPDGQWLAYLRTRGAVSRDVVLLPTRGAREPVALFDGPDSEVAAVFSPDGRWIAFVSDQSGRAEVYVASFPRPAARLQISSSGGIEPLWARSGRELFYREGHKLMVVPFDPGARDPAGAARALFEGRFESAAGYGSDAANYDVALDGRRFLMVRRKNLVLPNVIHVVTNWPQTLGAQ
ncbi:MAG: protein kinase domain-containing protein [Acidobacteriota bacterium]